MQNDITIHGYSAPKESPVELTPAQLTTAMERLEWHRILAERNQFAQRLTALEADKAELKERYYGENSLRLKAMDVNLTLTEDNLRLEAQNRELESTADANRESYREKLGMIAGLLEQNAALVVEVKSLEAENRCFDNQVESLKTRAELAEAQNRELRAAGDEMSEDITRHTGYDEDDIAILAAWKRAKRI